MKIEQSEKNKAKQNKKTLSVNYNKQNGLVFD